MWKEIDEAMSLCGVIGKNLKELRMKSSQSQEDLAKKIGISASNLREIEYGTGNPTVATLERIAEGLHVPTGALVSSNMNENEVYIRESIFSYLKFIQHMPPERQTLVVRMFEQLVLLLRGD